jgi:hypothetical protein
LRKGGIDLNIQKGNHGFMSDSTWMTKGAFLLAFVSGTVQGDDARISLLAHASDAHAAVFVTSAGENKRVSTGEAVPGTDLKLHDVDAAGVELRAAQTLHGQPFAVRLRDGESIALERLNVIHGETQTQVPHPAGVRAVRVPAAVPEH